ncbi:MAG: hypothetical protein J4N27_05960, partial [Chloroflexi bacterium]|nr:hypothetical protein [Chloroflexota bacterium]
MAGALLALAVACVGTPVTSDELDALDALDRGIELRRQGLMRRAYEELTEAVRLDPKLAEAYAERGFLYHLLSDESHAIDDLGRAIKLNSRLPIGYNYRGLVFVARGDA